MSASLTNHNPDNYSTHASFVYSAKFTQAVLALLDPQPGERIVDLGCGTGELTRLIAQAVGTDGAIVGIDSSQSMLDKASQDNFKTSGPAIEYIQGDIQTLRHSQQLRNALRHSFDKVFTSATLHWCKSDPGGVLETVKSLLRPGGSFVYEFGGFGNVIGVRSAFHQVLRSRGVDPVPLDPWYSTTAAQYEALLKEHGLSPVETALHPRPTPLPTGLRGWLKTFARNTFLAEMDEDTANNVMDEVEAICKPDMYWNMAHPGVGVLTQSSEVRTHSSKPVDGWELMYVRIRGKAICHGST